MPKRRTPKRRIATSELAQREYLTPDQAACVFGRGRDFWARRFDIGDVTGYAEETNRRGPTRYLLTASCRAYLASLSAAQGGWDPDAFARLCAADPRFQAAQAAGQGQ